MGHYLKCILLTTVLLSYSSCGSGTIVDTTTDGGENVDLPDGQVSEDNDISSDSAESDDDFTDDGGQTSDEETCGNQECQAGEYCFHDVCLLQVHGETYFVSPDGNDDHPGSFEQPWGTWGKAFNADVVDPGDIVYFRDGVYYKDTQNEPSSHFSYNDFTGYRITRQGTAENPVRFFNYPKENPILDNDNVVPTTYLNYGIRSGADYIHFKGLSIRNLWQVEGGVGGENVQCNGWEISGTNYIVENCQVYNIHGIGFRISSSTNAQFINCDAYNCKDPIWTSPGERGTGFSQINMNNSNASSYFTNCRAWECSDQGFSTYDVGYVEYKGCWSFNNGDLQAGGHGFKLGFTSDQVDMTTNRRLVTNCIAAYNRQTGFTQNCNGRKAIPMNIFNNIAYRNGHTDYDANGYGFVFYNTSSADSIELMQILKNNIAYDNDDANFKSSPEVLVTHEYNSWNLAVNIDQDDFESLDASQLSQPRNPDGSLPDITFGKLKFGSDLINAGVDVGLPYNGSAPDLGASESE
jgi:signal peptidase I